MRLKRNVRLLESTVRRALARPLLSSQCNRRRFASSSAAYPEQIAVLGGGISGLASAHFVAKEFPNSNITVFESAKEAGGWLRSRRTAVPGGDVVFEYGPRTLRPGLSSVATVQLIADLQLQDNVLFTKSTSPAAKNRYIYYPDRLNRMPSGGIEYLNTLKLLQSGVFDGALNIIAEPWKPRRPSNLTDESIGSFISRRMDRRIAQNLLSALMHGIYAGDIWQLSARTLLPMLWQLEGQFNSVIGGMLQINMNDQRSDMLVPIHPYDLESFKAMSEEIEANQEWGQNFIEGLAGCSTFAFKDGLQQLSRRLQDTLEKNKQVEIRMESRVQSYKMAEGNPQQVQVITGEGASQASQNFDLVISTLPNKTLTPYVTVMTVNLYYPNPNLIPVSGFGYLIPQSVPFEQNPERALGVIFDSDAVHGQDSVDGTKITVMLGGHWWNGWQGYPDEDEGAELAKSVIHRHLGIADEPAACHVNLHHDCIPQYTVGYEDRLKLYAEELQLNFRGKVRVVGNQYNGVGVNDCVKAAWNLARELRGDGWKSRSCGLDRVLDTRPWTVEPVMKTTVAHRLGQKDV